MKLARPSSILHLILAALTAVSVPLVIAIGLSAYRVDHLATRSHEALVMAESATRAARSIVEQVTVMERGARQYLVLGEPGPLEAYREAREEFLGALERLRWSAEPVGDKTPDLEVLAKRLASQEAAIHQRMRVAVPGATPEAEIGEAFLALSGTAERVRDEIRRRIWGEAGALPRAAERLQRIQLWLAAASLLATVVLGTLFVYLISRPLRKLDGAIRTLGSGALDTPIRVEGGPRDLEELGSRLEWLRVRLGELETQKATFLRHVSHELKTPLTAIREGAALLAERTETTPLAEQQEIAAIVEENSVALQKLIEDLLKASTRSSTRASRTTRRVPWHEVVRKVISAQRLAVAAKELRIETDLEPLQVLGDPEELRVIVDNLLSNAVKFSRGGGTINLTLLRQDRTAVLEVVDDGPGIAAEERQRIFEPFYQGRALANGPVKGSGLGLAIASEYVDAHDGFIECVADPSRGHLRVVLPLDGEAGPAAPEA